MDVSGEACCGGGGLLCSVVLSQGIVLICSKEGSSSRKETYRHNSCSAETISWSNVYFEAHCKHLLKYNFDNIVLGSQNL